VIDGFNGFHARTADDWERHLEALIRSPELRARFGASGARTSNPANACAPTKRGI